jgi:hypothetical protein
MNLLSSAVICPAPAGPPRAHIDSAPRRLASTYGRDTSSSTCRAVPMRDRKWNRMTSPWSREVSQALLRSTASMGACTVPQLSARLSIRALAQHGKLRHLRCRQGGCAAHGAPILGSIAIGLGPARRRRRNHDGQSGRHPHLGATAASHCGGIRSVAGGQG